jgi:mannose-6-phosphate isomerase class I
MGTHPNGPSVLKEDPQVPLKALLNESTLTPALAKAYDSDLPFLFKVLSIRKALSIQAHPDKQLASKLFKEFPDLYKDPNQYVVCVTDGVRDAVRRGDYAEQKKTQKYQTKIYVLWTYMSELPRFLVSKQEEARWAESREAHQSIS